jgi:HSP20 family protein
LITMDELKADEEFFEKLAKEARSEPPAIIPADLEPGQNWSVELAKAASTASRRHLTPSLKSKGRVESLEADSEGQLTIDVYQTAHEIVVESAIAGVRPEHIDIDVTSDSVTIRGERQREDSISEEDYIYRECYWGRFSRSIILPEEIDPENASVSFKNGILTVRLPKIKRQKAKKLKIKLE